MQSLLVNEFESIEATAEVEVNSHVNTPIQFLLKYIDSPLKLYIGLNKEQPGVQKKSSSREVNLENLPLTPTSTGQTCHQVKPRK